MKEMAENMAANGFNNMVDETGSFEANMQLVKEGCRLYKEFDEAEPDEEDLRRKKLQNDILEEELREKQQKNAEHLLDRDHEIFMQVIEKQTAQLEYDAKLTEFNQKKKNEKWDKGLKIAGIAAPIVGIVTTGIVGAIVFKQKTGLVNETLKLNTVLQEKGMISGLNNSKIVSDQFNELLKK